MNNPIILITGGLGYIGSHTVLVMLEKGFEIEIIDDLSNSKIECLKRLEQLSKKKINFHQIDLLDKDKLEDLFKNKKFDSIIHFAGLKAVGESVQKPVHYYRTNINVTLNLLDCCEKFKCNNFIFSSSACVYGNTKEGVFSENMALDPINPYGKSKLMQETILKDFCFANKDFKVVSLRYFNPAGSHPSGLIGEDPKGIPNNLFPVIEKVVLGKRDKLSIFGKDYSTHDGTAIRDYIHVMDLAEGHISALNKLTDLEKGYHVYNLGIGKGFSVLDVLTSYSKVIGQEIKHEFTDRRAGDSEKCISNPEKAWKELNWKANKDIIDMCKDSYNWVKNNPN